jgi:hypothetical protein
MLGFYPSSPDKAETLTTYGASDFYFELEAGTTFTVRTTAQSYGIDSFGIFVYKRFIIVQPS